MPFRAILPATKMVTVLIFALFCPRPFDTLLKAALGLELTAQGRLSLVAGVSPSAGRKGTSLCAGLFVGA